MRSFKTHHNDKNIAIVQNKEGYLHKNSLWSGRSRVINPRIHEPPRPLTWPLLLFHLFLFIIPFFPWLCLSVKSLSYTLLPYPSCIIIYLSYTCWEMCGFTWLTFVKFKLLRWKCWEANQTNNESNCEKSRTWSKRKQDRLGYIVTINNLGLSLSN